MSQNPNVFVGPKPKIGVIGGGHLGRIHAKLAAANSICELVGVADPSVESRQLVQSQLNIAAVTDYREWLGIVDGVIVAAPTFLHHEIGLWCLNRGIHVLMEKPVASTLVEANQLVSAAKANHRTFQVGHVERFNPAWKLATSQFSSSSIRYIEASREGTYTGRSTDIGIVMDLMIHDIDLILSAVDSPLESVAAYGWNVLGKNEDFATASLCFLNGTIANLRASRVAQSPKRTMQVFTDEGLTEIDFATNCVTLTAAVEEVANGTRQADALPAELRAKVKDNLFVDWLNRVEQKATPANAIEQEQSEFFRAIQTGSSVTVTGEQGCQALEVASRILEQIAANQPVRSIIPAAGRFGKTKAA